MGLRPACAVAGRQGSSFNGHVVVRVHARVVVAALCAGWRFRGEDRGRGMTSNGCADCGGVGIVGTS
jgi:hypothetical protein